jgi:hypothetical protein
MHLNPVSVKRVSLICVAAMRGDGTERSPERAAHDCYSDSGELMACAASVQLSVSSVQQETEN